MTIRERLDQAGLTETPESILARTEQAAEQFRLPFNQKVWRGQSGNWSGAGVGSSIDFQDHRPYVPGDDPRYINWQAYARSGNYSMKLYREEVSPQVDLVLDLSDSLFVQPDKARRALELFYFACQSAWRHAALINVVIARGESFILPQTDSIRAFDWALPDLTEKASQSIDWGRIPWRAQSMRVVISDFLFDEDPGSIASWIARQAGTTVLWSVYTQAEAEPDWLGNIELRDCESDKRTSLYFTREDIEQYQQRYNEHFTRWADCATRHSATFSKVPAEAELAQALLEASGLNGGVELCN